MTKQLFFQSKVVLSPIVLEEMKLLHKQETDYLPILEQANFQGTNGEIIEVISSGKLKVSDKTGKSLFTIESDGTTTGLKIYRIFS